ncbi:hypothetical protein K1719_038545 [Acacia pycnantha]|nr:hypothetical protein K1719_038545 [Acacia pycnantha]
MDVIDSFLNLVAPSFTFFFLALFLPAYWSLKFFLCTLNSIFAENLSGKVVLVTGASSGIGQHLAYEYGKRCARLALSARRENALQEVAERAREFVSPDVIIIHSDVSNVEDCSRMVDDTVNHFGRLDHLVNNEGVTTSKLFQEETDIKLDTLYGNKLVGINSWLPAPKRSVYNASKAAVTCMYETLRVEVGSEISITIVSSGYKESEATKGKFVMGRGKVEVDQDLRDVEVSAVPVGSASECAKVIVKSVARGERLMHMTGDSAKEAYSKKILDSFGAKNVFYQSSIQTSDVKTD